LIDSKKVKIGFGAIVIVAIVGLAGPALAEGSYVANFSAVNPDFNSNHWTDHQNDAKATKVAYSGCSYSNGVAVTSLTVSFWDQHGIFPDQKVGSSKSTTGCGSVSWAYSTSSYTLRDSTFHWRFDKMNGTTGNRWLDGTGKATY